MVMVKSQAQGDRRVIDRQLFGRRASDHGSLDQLLLGTVDIVCTWLGGNAIAAADLPDLVARTYAALATQSGNAADAPAAAPVAAAIPPVADDKVVCLECGRTMRSLRHHLNIAHQLDVKTYREKWHLPADHPMVAPEYARSRAVIARGIGLGQKKPARKG